MALSGVLLAGAVSFVLVKTAGVTVGHASGLFAGAGTSTPRFKLPSKFSATTTLRWVIRSRIRLV
jgi:uncharacterized transporter YbjL